MSTSRLLPAGLLALALAGGCGAPVTGAASPATAATTSAAATTTASSVDAVAWADRFCGAVVEFQKSSQKQPQIDPNSPTKALAGLRTYIRDFIAAIDKAVGDLKAAGPSPTPSGDAAVTTLSDYLTSVRASFVKAQSLLDKANTSDPSSITAAVEPLSGLEAAPDALKDLGGDPTLDAAAAKAPNCRTLNAAN